MMENVKTKTILQKHMTTQDSLLHTSDDWLASCQHYVQTERCIIAACYQIPKLCTHFRDLTSS